MRWLGALALILSSSATRAEPPATVSVAFDRHGIRPVVVEGLADAASGRAVDIDSPVRVASVSKLVTALGVLRLVDAGVLDLDRDVSSYLGWRLRHPDFPDSPITLRLLLSHQSGLVDDGERYIVPLGETLRGRLAARAMWEPGRAPGSGWFHYANVNFPVVASVMEAATGERFDRLMQRLVFVPLELAACYNWSGCDDAAVRRAVVLYRADGAVARDDLGGRAPACPVVPAADGSCDLSRYRPGDNGALFSPQGGLRIAMRDLARLGQRLAAGGTGFLTRSSFAALVGPHWRLAGDNGRDEDGAASGFFCAYGLGLQRIGSRAPDCRDDLFADGRPRLGHSGEAYGLRSGLWWDPRSRRGVAYFTTRVPDDAPKGASGFTLREEALVRRR